MNKYLIQAKNIFWELFVPNRNNAFRPGALKSIYLFWYAAGLLAVKIALITLALILPATNFFSSIAVDRLASLINQERQNRNLPTLTINTQLNSAASLKINDMLAQNYFEHTSPSGNTPWYWFGQIGYNFVYAGENLAMGFTETDTVFRAWMNSPTHRDNILNPNFKEIGLAIKTGQIQNRADTLAVLIFGRQPAKNKIARTPAKTITPAPIPVSVPKKPADSSAPLTLAPSSAPSPAISGPTASQPSASPSITLTQTPLTPSKTETQPPNIMISDTANIKLSFAPRVLGSFASKSDETFKSLYLYFTLFMAIALAVNIFVKIEIQYWPTIMATTLIILLSAVLIFI